MKKLILISLLSAVAISANAAQYNSAVGNVFAFCEAPKPCNKCQPMRSYYEQLCETNKAEGQRAVAEQTAQAQQLLNQTVQPTQQPQPAQTLQTVSQTETVGSGQQPTTVQQMAQQQQQKSNNGGFGIMNGGSEQRTNTLDLLK